MKTTHILAAVLFSIIAVGGLVTANGVTGNLIAGCSCVTSACVSACGDNPTVQCCTAQDQTTHRIPKYPSWPAYGVSFVGLAGFFTILAMNKNEEEMY